jgi:hypothetical protein
MYLSIDPQLEAIKGAIREHDFRLALFFFVLEAVLLVWLLPTFLDKRAEQREERRRAPARGIAADRIADSNIRSPSCRQIVGHGVSLRQ